MTTGSSRNSSPTDSTVRPHAGRAGSRGPVAMGTESYAGHLRRH
ncbi:hypothetical protein ATKI12_5733 [Kitasatospora sp. Ki12]